MSERTESFKRKGRRMKERPLRQKGYRHTIDENEKILKEAQWPQLFHDDQAIRDKRNQT